MNLLYLKYAATVADCGSISKAAERLYIDQPNLSRSIKDLETSMGVKLFERSARGMKLTPDGEEFLKYARVILSEVDAMENMFRSGDARKQRFSLSVPRASYISEAFAAFSERFSDIAQIEAFYKETNPMRTLKNILEDGYNLGIIRYATQYDKYYKEMLEEKGLSYELICEFRFVLLTSRSSPIATKETVSEADLLDLTEVLYGDPYVPSMPLDEVRKEAWSDVSPRRIFVFERGSRFDLLAGNSNTFMWVAPIPQTVLDRYGLVQRTCGDGHRIYKDILIRRKEYKLSELDNAFIAELCRTKREVFREGTSL